MSAIRHAKAFRADTGCRRKVFLKKTLSPDASNTSSSAHALCSLGVAGGHLPSYSGISKSLYSRISLLPICLPVHQAAVVVSIGRTSVKTRLILTFLGGYCNGR